MYKGDVVSSSKETERKRAMLAKQTGKEQERHATKIAWLE